MTEKGINIEQESKSMSSKFIVFNKILADNFNHLYIETSNHPVSIDYSIQEKQRSNHEQKLIESIPSVDLQTKNENYV
jgi:hypothetical protein